PIQSEKFIGPSATMQCPDARSASRRAVEHRRLAMPATPSAVTSRRHNRARLAENPAWLLDLLTADVSREAGPSGIRPVAQDRHAVRMRLGSLNSQVSHCPQLEASHSTS